MSFASFTAKRWGRVHWALVGLVLLAWALRVPPLLASPLHPDEALYGYWGLLIGRGRDPWLRGVPVYKPPLWPYVVSVFQLLLGDTKIALRLPGAMAGLLSVPLVGALAGTLYRDLGTGVSAGVVAALSPFAVTFSGTAFLDPWMVTLGLGACVAAARGRMRWAGLLAGLSFATKQTGLIWLPMALAVALSRSYRPASWIRGFGVAYLAPAVLVFAWDGIRVALGADEFWSAGVVGYGGLRLIWSHELWPRLRTWSGLMASVFGSPVVNLLLLAGLPVLLWRALIRHPRTRRAFYDLLLISFCTIYLLLHWLVAFPIWSRYLLPLVPMLAVLLGRIARIAADQLTMVGRVCLSRAGRLAGRGCYPAMAYRVWFPALLLALLLALPAGRASASRSPLADEHAPYRGIDDVISFFSQLPEGSVVYHHWLGWHYHYGLFDAPVYLAYWPNPAWLARDVRAFGSREPRYMAFPGWESTARVKQALGEVGYALEPVPGVPAAGDGRSFRVYRVVPSSSR